MIFTYDTAVRSDWIDYNRHMQDAYYGLVFSQAVDALQDAVGFDAAYRQATGCTIYLIEDHKFYLAEVKEGAPLRVETRVLAADAKRFHLWAEMTSDGTRAAVCEMMQLHVRQHPAPCAEPMPDAIARTLAEAVLPLPADAPRSGAMGFRRRG